MWLRWAKRAAALSAIVLFGYAFLDLQAQRTEAGVGAQRFMEYCAGCHGADGRGGDKAPPIVSASREASPSDAELFRIVHDGTKDGMPPFAQIGEANIRAVVEYLRTLEGNGASDRDAAQVVVTGDVKAGRALYFGKARCSTCHLMQGKGGFIAGNLTAYARNRTADAILRAITAPDTPPPPSSRVVTVTTRTGRKLTGVLRNEDNFNLALQTEDGRYHLLARSDVTDLNYTGHSLMPRDYSSRLSPQELNDIVSFLIVASRDSNPDKAEGR
jgi:putative heme-binding domain-containing protein